MITKSEMTHWGKPSTFTPCLIHWVFFHQKFIISEKTSLVIRSKIKTTYFCNERSFLKKKRKKKRKIHVYSNKKKIELH